MEKILDLEFLKDKELNKEIILEIIPQAPLSIIGKLNSRYKKLDLNIRENMVYGMLENVLGFHFKTDIRNTIKKKFKLKSKATENQKQGIAYLPIIKNVCEIISVGKLKGNVFYDYYRNHLTRDDGKSHFNQCSKDYSLEEQIYSEDYNNKSPNPLHSVVGGKISMYYGSPFKREFINIDEHFHIILKTNEKLYNMIVENININCCAYFGNSESLVNLKIKE